MLQVQSAPYAHARLKKFADSTPVELQSGPLEQELKALSRRLIDLKPAALLH